MPTLILVLVLFAFAWVFLVLPSRRKQRSHSAMQEAVSVGDEIISAGGIHGIVRETGEEDIEFEIAPGVVVTLDRRAIAAVAEDLPDDDEEDGEEEPDEGLDEDDSLDEAEDGDQAEESLKG